MRTFVAVLEKRSLSAAAKSLGVSLPTVSRTLHALEREVGARLIARTTRGLAETDSGRLYYERCRRILDDIREADAAVQSHARAPSGELRVTAPVTFGSHHVAPVVASFLERYPRISFNLALSDVRESLSDHQFDLAIRIARLTEENLTARRLGYVQRAVVGSREYFARHGVPAHPRDLARHNCMHYTHYLRGDEWRFSEGDKVLAVKVRGRLRTNNQEALADAVLAGAGLAILPTWLIEEPLKTGHMRRVLAQFEAPRTPVHAIFPTTGAPPGKVRAFVDFLLEHYRAEGILSSRERDSYAG